MTKFYAAHDDAFIYGIGDCPDAALEEWKEGVGDDQMLEFLGSIAITPMTDALYALVQERGGSLPWGVLTDGSLCTLDQSLGTNTGN